MDTPRDLPTSTALIKGPRAVALLDVLGFSDHIRQSGTDGLDGYLGRVVQLAQLYFSVDTILFSDTIVLYGFDDKNETIDQLLELTSVLAYELLALGFPTRGAIAHGDISVSEPGGRGVVVAGVPIVDAHVCESQTDWSGTMLAPSILRRIRDLSHFESILTNPPESPDRFRMRLAKTRVQPCAKIPFKGDATHPYLEGFAVVPLPRVLEQRGELIRGLKTAIGHLKRLKQLAPDPRSQAKFQHSIVWLEEFIEPWSQEPSKATW